MRGKFLDSQALLELRMPSSRSESPFPLCFKNIQLTFLTITAEGSGARASLTSREQATEDAGKTSIFSLVETESQTESCERGNNLRSSCSAFYIQPSLQLKKKIDAS